MKYCKSCSKRPKDTPEKCLVLVEGKLYCYKCIGIMFPHYFNRKHLNPSRRDSYEY